MRHPYRELTEHIPVPEGLDRRVLAAARAEVTAPAAKRPLLRRPLVRGAAAAACAFVLVLGSVTLRPGREKGTAALPALSFGLTAYAAETGEVLAPSANGTLAFFDAGEAFRSPSKGFYTGCLFHVTGENIATVSLSVDRGGLYRTKTREVPETEAAELMAMEEQGLLPEGTLSVWAEDEDSPTRYVAEAVLLGDSVTEDYDPAADYGFWTPVEDLSPAEDLREEFHRDIDTFDGARLTVTVTDTAGQRDTRTYRLSTGRLKVVWDEEGGPGRTVLPQLAGENEPYVYGIYAADETASRFLDWPVQGSYTVSLSHPYDAGSHQGIDIPAPAGEAVLAAMDGTVTETGFDPALGNYLVLDHGGGLSTLYGACRSISVETGDDVAAGEMVAAVGATGQSTGPHLHFAVRQDGAAQNPVVYFDAALRDRLTAA